MIVTLMDVVLYGTYFFLLFFSIFWMLVLFTSEPESGQKKKMEQFPFFTAIVPAYNEEDSIVGTLESLIRLDYPKDEREIIVVNDGSKDKTKELVEEFISQHPEERIILLNQANQGKGRAMNCGLSKAKGEFFACLDADSFVSSNALNETLPYFDDPEVAAVCPLLKVKRPKTVLQKVQWYEYIINMFYKKLNAKLDCIHVTPGPFSIYRTEVVRKIGGFDEHNITEDLEIAIRLQKHQYRIVQTFDAEVETVSPKSWKDLFKQRVRWYKGSVDNTIAYRKLMFNKKYGDFGYLRMPTVVFSGIVAIILSLVLFREAIVQFYRGFISLKAVNFDLANLIFNFKPNLNFLNLPFSKYFIALTLMGISLFVMVYSYRLVREKITNHGKTLISLVTYVLLYGLFMTAVWLYIAFLVVTKKKNTW